jgi:PBSX family phage terminase large subunit
MTQESNKIHKIKLLKKQLEFVNSSEREVCYCGAKGSGKSYALACKLYKHATFPNSFCLLTRKSGASIKSSTLRSLLYGEKDCPPVLIPGSYEYSESKNLIKIHNGGIIQMLGFDDPLRIRSINASCVAIDEGVELDETEYLELLSRIRNTSSMCRQIFTCTNPGSPNHFLYRRFISENDGTRKMITAQLLDNKFLPQDYIDEQLKLKGTEYNRYVLGQWCSSDGQVYKEFNFKNHVKEQDIKNYNKFFIGVDVGYSVDPTAIIVIGKNDIDDSLHVFSEYSKSGTPPTEIIEKIESIYKQYPNSTFIIDPSASGIRLDVENKGINIIKGNNSILEGISRVKDLLINNKISFSNNCSGIFKELDLYSYGANDKPLSGNDHFMDGLRYAIAYYFDSKAIKINPKVYFIEDGKDDVGNNNIKKEQDNGGIDLTHPFFNDDED